MRKFTLLSLLLSLFSFAGEDLLTCDIDNQFSDKFTLSFTEFPHIPIYKDPVTNLAMKYITINGQLEGIGSFYLDKLDFFKEAKVWVKGNYELIEIIKDSKLKNTWRAYAEGLLFGFFNEQVLTNCKIRFVE